MEVLKFTLSGQTAFFKNPEVNTYVYISYGCIHKVALTGMLGAIMGYTGYAEQRIKKASYPEFYEILKDLSIGIVPRNDRGYVKKKIQSFNNTVGYASREMGGILNVREQWLEKPIWDIYFQMRDDVSRNLAEKMTRRECVYIPYLGKNDHPADITDVLIQDGQETEVEDQPIDSIFSWEQAVFDKNADDDDDEKDLPFLYREYLPARLDKDTNQYETKEFAFTNMNIHSYSGKTLMVQDKKIAFF